MCNNCHLAIEHKKYYGEELNTKNCKYQCQYKEDEAFSRYCLMEVCLYSGKSCNKCEKDFRREYKRREKENLNVN